MKKNYKNEIYKKENYKNEIYKFSAVFQIAYEPS